MEKHLVTCPSCGHKFSVESVIENDIRESLRAEFELKAEKQQQDLQKKLSEIETVRELLLKQKEEQEDILNKRVSEQLKLAEARIKKNAEAELAARMDTLKEENELKAKQLLALRQREADFEKKEREWKNKMEEAELDLKMKLAEREEAIKIEAETRAIQKAELAFKEKEAEIKRQQETLAIESERKAHELAAKIRTEEELRRAELQKQLDDQKKLVDEMKRKAEQGSMQLQGEVQELAIENYLRDAYPTDIIENIKTGARGADVLQVVRNSRGQECGKIYYESKRTKDFQQSWLPKFKEDMRASSADIGILVTDVLPKGMSRFDQIDGIWICTFTEFKAMSLLMRDSLLRIQEKVVSQENKGDKMVMLYDYLSSNEFRAHIEAIVEGFTAMRDNLEKEKKMMFKSWKEREKQIDKVIENTTGMYGSIKGIAGGAVKEIKQLDMGDGIVANEDD